MTNLANAGIFDIPPVQVGRTALLTQDSSGTTFTFAAADFGAAHPDRKILFLFSLRAASSPTITSVTIGGVAASLAAAYVNTAGGNVTRVAIYAAAVPTGTAGSIVVTMSGTTIRVLGTVFRAIASSLTAYASIGNGDAAPSVALDVPSRGFIIAGAYSNAGPTAATWSGIAEVDDIVATGIWSSGLRSFYS